MRLSFQELNNSQKRKMIPEVPGFYKVFLPAGFELRIAEKTVANEKCYSKKEQMEKEYLENIWKPLKEAGALNDGIIYIGKGINIRNRLKLYKRVMFMEIFDHPLKYKTVYVNIISLMERSTDDSSWWEKDWTMRSLVKSQTI